MSTSPTPAPAPGWVWTPLGSEEFAALPRAQQARLNVIARTMVTLQGAQSRLQGAEVAHHRAIYDALEAGVPSETVSQAVALPVPRVRAIRRQVAEKIEEAKK